MRYTEQQAKDVALDAMKRQSPECSVNYLTEKYFPPAWKALCSLAKGFEVAGDYILIYYWGLLPLLAQVVANNVDHGELIWAPES